MSVENVIDLLFQLTGKTGDIAEKILKDRTLQNKNLFFTPFDPINPKKDAGFRALTVVTAPIAASILSVTSSLVAIFLAFKSLYDLSVNGKDEALVTLGDSGTMLLASAVALLVGVIGPLANLIDLIGSGINSLGSADESAEVPYSTSPYASKY